MAPPVPVYNLEEIRHQYKDQFENPQQYKCHLKSLTQHECTFRPSSAGNPIPEFICLPFKRLFQRCLIPTIRTGTNGEKIRGEKWVNIEVTDTETNSDLLEKDSKYANYVKDFLSAEKELKEMLEQEAEGRI
ncbi:hypothetical protein PVL30_003023 [Lodderomyces elongisporus]|uniref:Uncharacterized protein n=1 Tax=Lodderomyces elongisporus (strain ATCC 11503 / CBS 2605 / JCM 1781 / NBRC 1676 / NRRL YB-4239) TaxID=379508 RepID=A5E1P7_LODEL|nr:uncharacterized protein PVL30_003023 [Lodderomyces elongisporus]EDK45355.1 hypothetical protein LELG_03534 [Lodderomyces elongisporus NRRL YB-4239]WLF79271.1 hypothetical protein PVL30_003023 [Lodderomyces elongisporus]